jgi:hypothetical protein
LFIPNSPPGGLSLFVFRSRLFLACWQAAEFVPRRRSAAERSMVQFLMGVLLSGASSTVFWALRPFNGQPHRIIRQPLLEIAIPITITMGLVIGLAMIVAGIANLNLF